MANAVINKYDLIGKELTWEEIKKYFPDQWVGLSSVKHKNGNSASIESGVLKHFDKSQSELIHLALIGDCISRYTTIDSNQSEVGVIER